METDVNIELRVVSDGLLVTGLDSNIFPLIETEHDLFNSELLKVLNTINSGGLQITNDTALTMQLLAKTVTPMLQIYIDHPEAEHLYRESFGGLIYKT